MIRILPCFFAGQDKGVLSNGNAYFHRRGNHKLILSYPAGYYPSTEIDESQMLISKGFSDYFIYDFVRGVIEQDKPSLKMVKLSEGEKWLIDEELWPDKTVLVELETGRRLEIPGKYSYVTAEKDDLLVIAYRKKSFACIQTSSGEVIWSCNIEGRKHPRLIGNCLIFYVEDTELYTTRFYFYDIASGALHKEFTVNWLTTILMVDDARIVMKGFRQIDNKDQCAFVHYFIERDEVKEVPVDPDSPYLSIWGGVGLYCEQEDQIEVWKRDGEGEASMTAVDFETGKTIARFSLPNVCFPQFPGFSVHEGQYFAAGIARTPWPASYGQMVVWDKEDLFDPDPEIYEEPLMGAWERVVQGNQSFYRVYVDHSCESFFQLHRQLSVALHQCGAIHGYHRNSEGNDHDVDFGGRIVCDVSMHSLTTHERLAIKNLCDFMALELAEGGFRAGYDPGERITIEPSFQWVEPGESIEPTSTTLNDNCGVDFSGVNNARSLFAQMREHCRKRTCVIGVDCVELPSVYMDIFRSLAVLAGISGELKRVLAEHSQDEPGKIDFSFYWRDQKFVWHFDHTFKYLSEVFWSKARAFFQNRARKNIIIASDDDEPFIELFSLSPSEMAAAQQEGWSLVVFVHAADTA